MFDLQSLASFVRWRLKPLRWSGKLLAQLKQQIFQRPESTKWVNEITLASAELESHSHTKIISGLMVPNLDIQSLIGRASGKSFVDISCEYPTVVTETFLKVMNIPDIQKTILNYFDGSPYLWNVALNYSDASNQLNDSQLWHFDYGDTRQLHIMVYFNDVEMDSGPFTFLNASTSRMIKRSPLIIERLTDENLAKKYDIDVNQQKIKLIGLKGDVFAADPGRLLHQGARCKKPRLVLFVTFTTQTPMSKGGGAVMNDELRKGLWDALEASGVPLKIKKSMILS